MPIFSSASEARLVVALGGLALGALSSCDEVELPTAPDLRALARAYERPDGRLDDDLTRAALTGVNDRLSFLRRADVTHLLHPALEAARVQLRRRVTGGGPGAIKEEAIDVDAVVTVERACDGWGTDEEREQPASAGRIELTATMRGSRVDPVFWGTAQGCRATTELLGERHRVRIDGKVAVFLSNPADLDLSFATWLVRASGTIDVDEHSVTGGVDFRATMRDFEVRIRPEGSGNIIFGVDVAGRLFARTADDAYVCDPFAARCDSKNGTIQF